MGRKFAFSLGLGVCLGLAGLVYAQAQRTLVINGKTASTDVRIINGRAYVPLADVAKALDMTVAVRGNTYEITKAGGANAMQGLTGKTGDWLFDGGWRFRVNRTFRTQSYTLMNEYYSETSHEVEDGEELIIVEYSYRNGNKTMQPFSIGDTALAGANGDSWPIFSNDFPYDGSRFFSRTVMPGAEAKGALIFKVKSGFQPKDLALTVGELAGYDDSVRPKKPTVFRISLSL